MGHQKQQVRHTDYYEALFSVIYNTKTKHRTALMITTQVRECMALMGTCSQTELELSWPCTAALCLSDPVDSQNRTGPYYHRDNELARVYCETFYLLDYRKFIIPQTGQLMGQWGQLVLAVKPLLSDGYVTGVIKYLSK